MNRDNSTCAQCDAWTLKGPHCDPKTGIGQCTRFMNEINLRPRIASWNDPRCVVFGRAANMADREAYISKMTGVTV